MPQSEVCVCNQLSTVRGGVLKPKKKVESSKNSACRRRLGTKNVKFILLVMVISLWSGLRSIIHTTTTTVIIKVVTTKVDHLFLR